MAEEKFYSVWDLDTFEPGKKIKIERTIFAENEAIGIAPYLNHSQAELIAALQES